MASSAVLVLAATVSGVFWLGGGGPAQTGDEPSPSGSPVISFSGKPPRPSTNALDDEGRCRDIAMQEDPSLMALPPLRFEVGNPRLRLRVYGDQARSLVCWATPERVDIDGPTMNVDAPVVGGLSYVSLGQGTGPAAVAFGRMPAGTTKVELTHPNPGGPLAAQLGEGWWIYWVPDTSTAVDLSEVIKVTAYTPTGTQSIPIQHG